MKRGSSAGGLKVKALAQTARDVGSSPAWCYTFHPYLIHSKRKQLFIMLILFGIYHSAILPFLEPDKPFIWGCIIIVNLSIPVIEVKTRKHSQAVTSMSNSGSSKYDNILCY